MAGRRLPGGSNVAVLENEKLSCSSQVLESLWIPNSSPTFQGSTSMLSFENFSGERPLLFHKEEAFDDDYNGIFLQPGKKRRLSVDQVQFLEKSFGAENKLEPEKKVQLAKEVGLEPRQVAIWFQNRRARYKTKQLEKDYDSLRAGYDRLQSEYHNLITEKDKLKQQLLLLKEKLQLAEDQEPVCEKVPETGSNVGLAPLMLVCKQEDASSAKSDVLDSDSPPAGSSNVFESDFSRDEGDDSYGILLKLEEGDGHFYQDQKQHPHGSCNFGFPNEDQLFCFWP